MIVDDVAFTSIVELKTEVRRVLMKNFCLPSFPWYNSQLYSENGQPYFCTFASKDDKPARVFVDKDEMIALTNS